MFERYPACAALEHKDRNRLPIARIRRVAGSDPRSHGIPEAGLIDVSHLVMMRLLRSCTAKSIRWAIDRTGSTPRRIQVSSSMIIEGIVTTLGPSGELNVAPMGPIVDLSMTELILRPFQSSTTFQNLKRHPQGVFHVVDDVLLIAQAALDRLSGIPETFPAVQIRGHVLRDCCRWYEFEISRFDDSQLRTQLTARVIHTGRVRDHFGFNRAKHAVLEVTILATRLHLIDESEVRQQISALASPVEKTAGPREIQAFQLVRQYVEDWYSSRSDASPSG
jgi:hypothetical protein